MALFEKIMNDMKEAMKAKDKERLSTVRMLVSEIKKRQIDSGKEFTDDEILGVIKSMVKSREDSVKAYKDGGREDLAEKEQREIEVLKGYLPKQLSEEEIEKIVEEAIKESGAESVRDMGKVMKIVMGKYGSQVDGKIVNKITKDKLS
ncbi:conserved hypothetical protein [Thermotomaculum hydrothermale]|uniref:GatB/YqeY domain-containing protein n=1 Tax=Thermotomaculum hydrothermale TaxID=981385 RepID=A0A7R6PGI5_9BACT|nr:GatB/YqeY domain-containing protein [Thermotomaculum hydrothermale]BBB33319.1 conserved hypothetical protein [Thermotomaculum hydrothermale]